LIELKQQKISEGFEHAILGCLWQIETLSSLLKLHTNQLTPNLKRLQQRII
jgi:hypothetical protein